MFLSALQYRELAPKTAIESFKGYAGISKNSCWLRRPPGGQLACFTAALKRLAFFFHQTEKSASVAGLAGRWPGKLGFEGCNLGVTYSHVCFALCR